MRYQERHFLLYCGNRLLPITANVWIKSHFANNNISGSRRAFVVVNSSMKSVLGVGIIGAKGPHIVAHFVIGHGWFVGKTMVLIGINPDEVLCGIPENRE